MFQMIYPAARRLAVAALIATFVSVPASFSLAAGKPKAATKVGVAPADHVEERITSLHASLRITAGQEVAWSEFAQAMRRNAKAMSEHRAAAAEDAPSRTAVDELKAYAAVIDEHANEIRNLLPTFQALYDGMSDSEKANADDVFRHHIQKAQQSHKG